MKKCFVITIAIIGMFLLNSCKMEASSKFSINNDFEMLKMIQNNNKSVVFAIRNCNDDFEKIMYYTPRYSYYLGVDVYWSNTNNDFFVLSHDVGVEVFVYKNDIWEDGYFIKIKKSKDNEYEAKLENYLNQEIVIYDINSIPKEVLDYLKQVIE